jgi:hypothetical protein
VKVAVAPESVPRLGARAALEIPLIFVEVHRRIRRVVGEFPVSRRIRTLAKHMDRQARRSYFNAAQIVVNSCSSQVTKFKRLPSAMKRFWLD